MKNIVGKIEQLTQQTEPEIIVNRATFYQTDLQRFTELYKSFGIDLVTEKYDDIIEINILEENRAAYCVKFTKDGKFRSHKLYY